MPPATSSLLSEGIQDKELYILRRFLYLNRRDNISHNNEVTFSHYHHPDTDYKPHLRRFLQTISFWSHLLERNETGVSKLPVAIDLCQLQVCNSNLTIQTLVTTTHQWCHSVLTRPVVYFYITAVKMFLTETYFISLLKVTVCICFFMLMMST